MPPPEGRVTACEYADSIWLSIWIAGEERHVVRVHPDLPHAFGRLEALHVFERALMCAGLVDQHFADVIRQVVAERPGHRVAFLVDQERRGPLAGRRDNRVPVGAQVVEVPLQFLGTAADARGTHDRAHAIGHVQQVERILGRVAFLALDAARDAAGAWIVRHQHEETACEADEGRQRSALVAALLFLHLDQEFLALLEDVADVEARAGCRLEPEIFPRDFLERQESLALGAVFDEGRFEARLDARDARLVDIAFLLFPGRYLDRKIEELLAVNQSDAQFLLLRRVYEHSFHGPHPSCWGPFRKRCRALSRAKPVALQARIAGAKERAAEPGCGRVDSCTNLRDRHARGT